MQRIRRYVVGGLILLCGVVQAKEWQVYPEDLGVAAKDAPIVLGQWHLDWKTCKDYADKNDMPMIAVWGNHGCVHCWALDSVFTNETFKAWQSSNDAGKVVSCIMFGGEKGYPDQAWSDAYYWLRQGAARAWPMVCLYWKSKGIEKFYYGDEIRNNLSYYNVTDSVQPVIQNMEKAFAGWKAPSYTGGEFADPDSEGNRLEFEAGTEKVVVNLKRAATAATNVTFKVVGPTNVELKSEKIDWAADETNKTIEVALTAAMKSACTADGQQLTLYLGDKDQNMATNHLTFVKREPSASNPLWLGERKNPYVNGAVPNLAFGEWTMDIDLATQVVARASGDAYTLVSIQGSKWCPDCANTDRNFLEVVDDDSGKNKFCAWAKAHNVALVSMDVPNYNKDGSTLDTVASPTLFSKKAFATTLARNGMHGGRLETPAVSGADPALTNAMERSGLGYLTRKNVTDGEAAAVMEKFRTLAVTNTDQGGFHRPEDANLYRTGVPIFVLLRKDGSVAARFTRFASVSPMAADQANFDNFIKRFEEMLAIAAMSGAHADNTEIENNYPGAGAISFAANGGEAEGELCNADIQDVFRLVGVGGNAEQKVKVEGESEAEVSVQFWQKTSDGSFKTLGGAATGRLSAGVELMQSFTEGGDFYLMVKAANAQSTEFSSINPNADNFVKFTVSGSTVLVPQEDRVTAKAPAGSDQVTIRLAQNVVYCFEGVTTNDNPFLVELAEAAPFRFLKSVVSGAVELKISTGLGGEIGYQIWKPGQVGFVETERTVPESINDADDDWVEFKLARTGGKSGRVKARVTVDPNQTTMDPNRQYVFETNALNAADFVWEDGITSNMTVRVKIIDDEFYDGDYQIAFNLEVLDSDAGDVGVVEGKSSFVLTVTEDDEDRPGRCLISGTEPECAKKGTVYARESEGAKLWLERIEACSGLVRAEIVSSIAGTTFATEDPRDMTNDNGRVFIWWSSREMTKKYVQVGNIPAGKTARIQLRGFGNYRVVSASNQVSVVSIADAAPQFQQPSYSFDLYRYLEANDLVKAPLETSMLQGGKVSFLKLSGTLPAGLKAVYDEGSGSLVFTGKVTARPGVYKVNYQVNEIRSGTKVPGLPTEITFTVADPTDVENDPEHANQSLTKTRIFKDLPVRSPNFLTGVLQLTVPVNGKLSAKYLCDAGTIAFSSKNWTEFNPDDKSITAMLTSRTEGYQLEVVVENDGAVKASIHAPDHGEVLEAKVSGFEWSKEVSASAWKGYYTVALPVSADSIEETRGNLTPRGSGYLTLRMDTDSAARKGTVKWAGLLPNGTAVSGSTTLGEPYLVETESVDENWAALPVFARSTTDVLSVFPKILAKASVTGSRRSVLSEYGEPTWIHHERVEATEADYSAMLGVYGSYYDKNEDLGGCCSNYYGKTNLSLAFDTSKLEWLNVGTPIGITSVGVKVDQNTMFLADDDENPSKVTLSFNRATGVVTGRANLAYQPTAGGAEKNLSVSYKGVVVTGWGASCGCGTFDVYLPFVNGAFYFSDKVEYGTEPIRKLSVKRGGSACGE